MELQEVIRFIGKASDKETLVIVKILGAKMTRNIEDVELLEKFLSGDKDISFSEDDDGNPIDYDLEERVDSLIDRGLMTKHEPNLMSVSEKGEEFVETIREIDENFRGDMW